MITNKELTFVLIGLSTFFLIVSLTELRKPRALIDIEQAILDMNEELQMLEALKLVKNNDKEMINREQTLSVMSVVLWHKEKLHDRVRNKISRERINHYNNK